MFTVSEFIFPPTNTLIKFRNQESLKNHGKMFWIDLSLVLP